jgi:hypothetical protein
VIPFFKIILFYFYFIFKFTIKEPPVLGNFSKNQNQRTAGSDYYFKTLKAPLDFTTQQRTDNFPGVYLNF